MSRTVSLLVSLVLFAVCPTLVSPAGVPTPSVNSSLSHSFSTAVPASAQPATRSNDDDSDSISATTDPAAANPSGTTPTLAITSVGESILAPDDDLSIEITLSNPTDEDITLDRISLAGQPVAPSTRTRLLAFLNDADVFLETLYAAELDVTVPARQKVMLPLTVARDSTGWSGDEETWGPHGIEVVVDGPGLDDELTDRSFVVVAPNYEVTPMPTGVVIPVTASTAEMAEEQTISQRTDAGLIAREEEEEGKPGATETSTASTGGSTVRATPTDTSTDPSTRANTAPHRISTLLTADNIPGVTTVFDPALLSVYADDDALTAAVTNLATSNNSEVIFTAFSDPDMSALVHGEDSEQATSAHDTATTMAEELGDAIRTDITLLAPEPDQETLSVLANGGTSAVIIAADEVPTSAYRYYTPSARTSINYGDSDATASEADASPDSEKGTDTGTASESSASRSSGASGLDALVVDSAASAALAGTLVEEDEVAGADDSAGAIDILDSRQLVLSLSAVTYRERPNDTRGMVLAVDRASLPHYGTQDPATATAADPVATENLLETTRALMGASWVSPYTVSQLLELDSSSAERQELPERVLATGEARTSFFSATANSYSRVVTIAAMSPDPSILTNPADLARRRLSTLAWRSDPAGRQNRLRDLTRTANGYFTAIYANPSSTINIISEATGVPLHIRNDLPVDVGVVIQLDTPDARLRATETVAVTLTPHSTTTVTVPVRASGSGNVRADVRVLNPVGTQVGPVQSIDIRVRANWENVGTVVVAGAFGAVLVVGVIRSLRRGRRSAPVRPGSLPRVSATATTG
ncbi:DUF6049 family protein [Actinobaculum sp. 352]|uniref:DUF6049 family protein n=1 Tax=Actinobaculum sp. 352 TaxID=2490946 RepID=UPI000F7F5E0C|nr:DUF6049 family protein [Actinobaculum sp. 352]RTE49781.1 hypothetical protein EKN07_04460 [Actinobaculum sp. 352]